MHTVADGLKCLARGFRIDLVGSEKLLQACARDTCPAIFAESQLLTQNMRSANKIKKKVIMKILRFLGEATIMFSKSYSNLFLHKLLGVMNIPPVINIL